METNQIDTQKPKTNAKDFFLNLGAIVALYTSIISLVNLLFAVINKAYPQITAGYSYYGSQSISWPVSIIIISFPIYILLMWLLEKGYKAEPDKKNVGIRKWLIYVTLFVAGIVLAGDLVTVLYYFIDGQELTAGFILKILSVFVVTLAVFLYYISDIRGKLNSQYRKIWLTISVVIIVGSIVWGFSVLGSPRNQRLLKYDEQKINDLQNINNQIQSYYQMKDTLPAVIIDLAGPNTYFTIPMDPQSSKAYEYKKTDKLTYELCAEFNKSSNEQNKVLTPVRMNGIIWWTHPAGHYCFSQTINKSLYPKPIMQ